MYLPKALGCKASVTLWSQVKGTKWKKQQKKRAHYNAKDIGKREEQIQLPRKTDKESYCTTPEPKGLVG